MAAFDHLARTALTVMRTAPGHRGGLATAALRWLTEVLDAALRGPRVRGVDLDAGGELPDFRTTLGYGLYVGWVPGAPGIALARMRLLQLLPDPPGSGAVEEQLRRRPAVKRRLTLPDRDHLCCGNLVGR